MYTIYHVHDFVLSSVSSVQSNLSIFTETILDFNFSAAPLNSDPSTFVMMFHNPGSIPVDWWAKGQRDCHFCRLLL